MAKSILGGFVLVAITAILLEIVDQLCIGIVQATGTSIEEMGTKIGPLVTGLAGLNLAAPGASVIITIFLGFLAMAAAAIVWFSLLIRKCLILILVVLGPIALAGAGWDVTRGSFAKWASFVIALIFSKFVVVLIFLIAISQVSAPIELDVSSIADPIAGIVLMLIAGFAPYMCYKLLSFAGLDMYALASTEQEAKQAANRPMPVPHAPKPDAPAQILDGKSTPDSGGGAPPDAQPSAPDSTPPGPASTSSGGGGTASAGTGATTAEGGSTAGATTTAGSAAGPVGLAVVGGVEVAKGVAEAGPKAGAAGHTVVDAAAESGPHLTGTTATAAATCGPCRPGAAEELTAPQPEPEGRW